VTSTFLQLFLVRLQTRSKSHVGVSW